MEVNLLSVSYPVDSIQLDSPGEFIAYCARVSNPGNQMNKETSPRLLQYLVKNQHWSPFEMVSICMEIKTTRDIARQLLRHRSFSFQEFSQRYAEVSPYAEIREARMQDTKNRQNSIPSLDRQVSDEWDRLQEYVWDICTSAYSTALSMGVAKEVARAVLPEGMTRSVLYMAGTVRSWIHYVQLRTTPGTQKEHREVAHKVKEVLVSVLPEIKDII